MKIYIEFLSWASLKAGRSWMWLEVPGGIKVRDLLLKELPNALGQDVAKVIIDSILNGTLVVLVNGYAIPSLDYDLNDGDKIYLQPLAAGG
ncbi:MAG: MoaD/ThiS family protein [Desulfurococcaceae archaeon]|jgi:molybdopterin converting factor small subunit